MELARQSVLVEAANIRAGLLASQNGASLSERLGRLCDSLASWASLPSCAHASYAQALIDALFEVAADVEEDVDGDARQRQIIELSLWDVAVELGLDQHDPQSERYIAARRERLLRSLRSGVTNQFQTLLYSWTLLLRHRSMPVPALPGDFREDLDAVVSELSAAGLPRRAQALAWKFNSQLDPVGKMTLAHRPPAEELHRTGQLIQRLSERMPIVPFSALRRLPALRQVLGAPIGAIPLSISGSGCITIERQVFGVTKRRY